MSAEAATGRATLQDVRAGVTWDLGKRTGAALADGGRSVVVALTPPEKDWARLLDNALSIQATDAGYALVPVREGLLIPADGTVEFSRRFGTSSYEGCHLNLLGLVKQGAALLLTWEDPYITPELVKKKRG